MQDIQLVILGLSLLLPPVVGLLYYKPWLPWRHQVAGGVFWTLQALDAASLLQTVAADPGTHSPVAMSVLARCVLLVLSTGFVLSSPLLLVSLMEERRGRDIDLLDVGSDAMRTYGRLYVKFAVVLDLTLWEIPDLGAKLLILSRSHPVILPTSFYCSLVKNVLFIAVLIGCVVKLFDFSPIWRKAVPKPQIPPEFREPVDPETPAPMTVLVDMEGRASSGLDIVTSGHPPNWERFVVIYGLVSCLILVGCMIAAVCLYRV